MTIYKRIQHNDIYCLDGEGHIREMSIGDRITDIICQVGTAVLSVGGLCWFAYMVIV